MGRPPQWFNHLLALHLRNLGCTVEHCADGFQADDLIVQNAGLDDSVLSVDRDFLAFARTDTISQIVFVDQKSHRPSRLSLADVLANTNVRAEDLAMAYIISGCDDARVSLKRFGWKSAEKLFQFNANGGQVQELVWTQLSRRFRRVDVEILREDVRLLSQERGNTFLYSKAKSFLIIHVVINRFDPTVEPEGQSMLIRFIEERDEEGDYRRPGLRNAIMFGHVLIRPIVRRTHKQARVHARENRALEASRRKDFVVTHRFDRTVQAPGMIYCGFEQDLLLTHPI
jgi:hypothetical protein